MSKYSERAKEILRKNVIIEKEDELECISLYEDSIQDSVKTMCQLVEEIEHDCNNKHTKEVSEFNSILKKEIDLLYTKKTS